MHESPVRNYSWYALSLLTLIYVFNYLDRTIIYILLPLIKREMAFTDLQLALLGSMSFVIFFTVLGIPFGRLADRAVRKNMIAAGLAVWSLFSGLTGFATGFWSLLVCRVMVGVGEATLGPAALSLLSDYFPPRVRATVQAIYSSGIAIGAGLAFFLGGWLGQYYGWRLAFYALGFPGLIIAVLAYFLREDREARRKLQARSTRRAIGRSCSNQCRSGITISVMAALVLLQTTFRFGDQHSSRASTSSTY